MMLPDRRARGPRRDRRAASTCRSRSIEWLDKWLEPVVPRRARGAPRHLHRRLRAWRCSRSRSRSAASCSRTRSTGTGLEHADRDPLNEKLGARRARARQRLLLRRRHRPARRRSGHARCASWLDRVVDTKIIDGAVNGVGSLFAASSRGVQQLQDGLVRRYALGIAVGTVAVAPLRRDLAGAVARGLPDPLRHPRHAVRRRGDLPAAPARRPERSPRRSATPPWRSRSASPLYLLWQFDAPTRRLPVRREPALDPRARRALHRRRRRHQPLHGRRSPRCCSRSACSRRRSTSSTASRRTSRGSCCSRARSWASSSPST